MKKPRNVNYSLASIDFYFLNKTLDRVIYHPPSLRLLAKISTAQIPR